MGERPGGWGMSGSRGHHYGLPWRCTYAFIGYRWLEMWNCWKCRRLFSC